MHILCILLTLICGEGRIWPGWSEVVQVVCMGNYLDFTNDRDNRPLTGRARTIAGAS
jgi:hypothetical protein